VSVVLAIDPGVAESGYCVYDGFVRESGTVENARLLEWLPAHPADTLAIEMITSYGMPVGREVFETCVWIGRFQQAWRAPEEVRLIPRRDIKMTLCANARAKDANIRRALIDLVGPQGVKRAPGPTYGVKSHAWAALAVAVCAVDKEYFAS